MRTLDILFGGGGGGGGGGCGDRVPRFCVLFIVVLVLVVCSIFSVFRILIVFCFSYFMQLLEVFRFSFSLFRNRTFMLMSHVLVVCVCFRTFLHVVIAYMCAMLNIEDHFWIEFTIELDQMHTFV